jgi:hypothetical protein
MGGNSAKKKSYLLLVSRLENTIQRAHPARHQSKGEQALRRVAG